MALQQRANSSSIDFLALPRKIRDEVYRSLFGLSHPIFLFQDVGSEIVESFAPERPFQWLALLYTNRLLYDEARTVLYSFNTFYLEDTTRHQNNLLQSFLDRIGSDNAGLLSHLCIDFPIVESAGQSARLELSKDDLHNLDLVQERCTKLKILELLLHGRNYRGLIKASQDDPHFIQEALLRIDTQLKTISPLNKIIIRCCDRGSSPWVTESMRGLDWVIVDG